MTPDREDDRCDGFETLVVNARGLAFAAFSSVDVLARALGCSPTEAEQFQFSAQDDFITMMMEARCRREKR